MSYYFRDAVDREPRKQLIQRCIGLLNDKRDQFDAVAFRGVSGALIGPVLADYFDKYLVIVRKPEDGHHNSSCDRLAIYDPALRKHTQANNLRYLIVDDFVETGNTVKAIVDAIAIEARYGMWPWTPVAVLTYMGNNWCKDDVSVERVERILPGVPIWGIRSPRAS